MHQNSEREIAAASSGPRPGGPSIYWVIADFDPRDHLPIGLWKHRHAVRYVVGLVANGLASFKPSSGVDDSWVPLRRANMETLFGRPNNWTEVKMALLSGGVLECDGHYVKGERSMHYRLGPRCRGREMKLDSLDEKFTARLQGMKANETLEGVWLPVHEHLAHWLQKTRADEAEVRRWVCQSRRSKKQQYTARKVAEFEAEAAKVSVCAYGRVHGGVVNFRSAARHALRIDGHRLAEADVRSVQPLLFGYCAGLTVTGDWTIDQIRLLGREAAPDETFQGYNPIGGGGEKEAEGQPERRNTRNHKSTSQMHLCRLMREQLPADLLDYIDVCESGRFYDVLAESWDLSCAPGTDRNRIKKLAFQYVSFGRPRPGHRYWEPIRTRWPTFARISELVKKDDGGTLARACQRIEASLMIGAVIERFRVTHPSIPVLTIHDSVMTPVSNIVLASEVVMDVFSEIGLRPTVKTTWYDRRPATDARTMPLQPDVERVSSSA